MDMCMQAKLFMNMWAPRWGVLRSGNLQDIFLSMLLFVHPLRKDFSVT